MVSRNKYKAALKMMIAASKAMNSSQYLYFLEASSAPNGRSEAAHQCIEIAPWSASNSHQVSKV
jgi:hypothetical protein